ncbi:MAG: glycoside hydrolase family 127 protein [Planctomycetes bacterium]|nr:glycoside hydrolase family 127 protein [Planctomycetota bacterium]MBL7038343.1 glycoside hydrolase family 127 protein [Pirellulaceae bacterium]
MRAKEESRRSLFVAVTLVAIAGFGRSAPAQERAIINNSQSPHSKLRSVDLSDVRWTDGFWKQKVDVVRNVTIPKMWEYYNGNGNSHWMNFRIAAGLDEGEWSGTNWHDGDLYKWIEAVAHVYMVTGDSALDQQMDEAIEVIGKVQEPDGYIWTRGSLEKRDRFQHIHDHELYNMGHLMTAACIHHRATGKKNFLQLAKKAGDCLHETFKDRKPELAHFGFNPSNIMGLVELYRTTGDREYLDLANTFIDMRGSRPGPFRSTELGGTDQTQDRVPLRKAKEAVGHAVCGTYLNCGAADAFMETGDKTLLETLQRLWSDVTRRKMYIHGGVGPFTYGLSPRRDHVGEAFGTPCFLPNRECYCETCSNIGNAMWNWRMLNITAEARYADIMERVFYNSGISGLAADGDHFFYSNVLRRLGPNVPLLRSDTPQRWKHRRGYCCPPQLARTIAKMHGFAYSTSEEGLWVHLYGSNELETELSDGTTVKLIQKTDYPWDGEIKIALELAEQAAFAFRLRIPGWAAGATVKINGSPAGVELKAGTYAALGRTWKTGDTVELTLPMRARLVQANPMVEELRGQVAVMRGPLVYCLESVDLPDGVNVMDIRLPRRINFQPRYDGQLLGGLVVLEGQAVAVADPDWSAGPYDSPVLYKDYVATEPRPLQLRLIPYHAWANRGEPKMTVWLPLR